MKLKKIASLALAGVMAASMLAGCNTGNSNSNSNSTPNQGETETAPSSAVVNVFNSKQNATSAVKVEFTGDAEMEKNLKEAVEMAGVNATASTVLTNYKAITGDTYKYKKMAYATEASGIAAQFTGKWNQFGIYDGTTTNNNVPTIDDDMDGVSNTFMLLVSVDATNSIQSPVTAAGSVANQLNSTILRYLDAEFYKAGSKHDAGEKYLAYSYAGTAGVVTGVDTDGKPVYYVAVTLTQNVSVETTPEV